MIIRKPIPKKKHETPLIIIAGFARCGTSILYKILTDSGLVGSGGSAKYASEDIKLFKICYMIDRQLKAKWVTGHMDLGTDMIMKVHHFPVDVSRNLKEDIVLYGYWLEKYNIQVLKNPTAAFAMPYLCKNAKIFNQAKFIKVTRPIDCVAKSLVRLKLKKWPQYFRKKMTVTTAKKIAANHLSRWEEFLKDKNHVHVTHAQIINQDLKHLEDFIGIPLELSAISRGETYAG